MKFIVLFIIVISVLFTSTVYSQDPNDPGIPDSLIFGIVDVNHTPGETSYVDVPVYFVTDDSISDFFVPVAWESVNSQVFPSAVVWHDIFLQWEEVYDSIWFDDDYIRCLGFYDLDGDTTEPLLFTNSNRLHSMTITFTITPDAGEQICTIDTVFVSNTFRLYFGMPPGLVDFVPVVVPGAISIGMVSIEDQRTIIPADFALDQNYPNPFNPITSIEYQVPKPGFVSIDIFNILGQQVRSLVSEHKDAGYHQIQWNGTDDNNDHVPSGIYFYRLSSENFAQTRRMLYLK